jgi:hypothetical protein
VNVRLSSSSGAHADVGERERLEGEPRSRRCEARQDRERNERAPISVSVILGVRDDDRPREDEHDTRGDRSGETRSYSLHSELQDRSGGGERAHQCMESKVLQRTVATCTTSQGAGERENAARRGTEAWGGKRSRFFVSVRLHRNDARSSSIHAQYAASTAGLFSVTSPRCTAKFSQ